MERYASPAPGPVNVVSHPASKKNIVHCLLPTLVLHVLADYFGASTTHAIILPAVRGLGLAAFCHVGQPPG